MKKMNGFPLYGIAAAELVLVILFRDRRQNLEGLLLALILFLGCHGLGKRLSYMFLKTGVRAFFFPFGLGAFLAASYLVFCFSTAPWVFYCLWGLLSLLALFEIPVLAHRVEASNLWGAPFVLLGLWGTLTPTTFFDALVYHLGLPHQYLAMGKMQIIPCLSG